MAFTAAAGGRPGPAVLIVPADLLERAGRHVAAGARRSRHAIRSIAPSPIRPQSRSGGRLLAGASGRWSSPAAACTCSGARRAGARCRSALQLPVATTTHGQGRGRRDAIRCRVGVVGYFMGPRGMARHQRGLVEDADVVLLVGAAPTRTAPTRWTLFAARRALHPSRRRRRWKSGATTRRCGCVGDAQADARGADRGPAAPSTSTSGGAARPALEAAIAEGRAAPRRGSRAGARRRAPDADPARSG